MEQASPAPRLQRDDSQYDIQVLISASMPDASLRALFAQAAAYGPEKVRFVLRGFKPKKVAQTIAYFRRFFPDPAQDYVIIEVDPPMFRALGVKSVPAFLVKDEQGRWWETRGDMSLTQAQAHVRKLGAPLLAGPLYPIDEPDLIDLLQAEAAKFDWAAYQGRIEQSLLSGEVDPGVSLPRAQRDRRFEHTPSVLIPEDMVAEGAQGEPIVLARQGQSINPLQHQPIGKSILVIDASDPKQLRWAKDLIGQPASEGACAYDVFFVGRVSIYSVGELLQPCRAWPLWPAFAQGFGVRATPSVLQQSGDRFVITEVDLSRRNPSRATRSP